uniref:LUC7 like n=1 Tax=Equus asinus TaxID=9793 RepID=A0A9L0I4R7_EQUAS
GEAAGRPEAGAASVCACAGAPSPALRPQAPGFCLGRLASRAAARVLPGRRAPPRARPGRGPSRARAPAAGGGAPPGFLGGAAAPAGGGRASRPRPLLLGPRAGSLGAFLTWVPARCFSCPPSAQEAPVSQRLAGVSNEVESPHWHNRRAVQSFALHFIGSVYLCLPTSICKGVAEKPHVHRAETKPDRGSSLQMTVSARVTSWTAAPMTSWLGRAWI